MSIIKKLVNESELLKTLQNKLLALSSEIDKLYALHSETEEFEKQRFIIEQETIHFLENTLQFEITRHIEDIKNICLKKTITANKQLIEITIIVHFYDIDVVTFTYHNGYYLFSNSVVRQLFTFDKSDLTKIDLLFIFNLNNNEILTVMNDSVLKNSNNFYSESSIINKIIRLQDKDLFYILYDFFIERKAINIDDKDIVNIKYDIKLENSDFKEIKQLTMDYKWLLHIFEETL